MKFFKVINERENARIRQWSYREARTASVMRILITAIIVIAFGITWFLTKTFPWIFFGFIILIAFYWVWYQLLPRIEQRWQREAEQEELRFVTLLYKYIDATALEDSFENLSRRVTELEQRTKQTQK